jgi:hypothetical protein
MSTIYVNPILYDWLHRSRHIRWELTFGLEPRKLPNIRGEFATNLAYLDDQGEKWGDTYIKIVGQHFEDYAHWSAVSTFLPIEGTVASRLFVPNPFTIRDYKDTAPGVTGLVGEVLVTVLLQNVFKLSPYDMAHLKDDMKAPDMCLDIEPKTITDIFKTAVHVRPKAENLGLAEELNRTVWSYPLPMECKSRRNTSDRQVRNAVLQLLKYWENIPEMAGCGIFAQVDLNPVTKIRLHLLTPKEGEADNVRKIITGKTAGTGLTGLPQKPTYEQFMDAIGGRLIG